MHTNLKVSIITVTYNSAKVLKRTMESVLNQTYKNIDYWIIDGASVDGTIDLIKAYETRFEGRLHWISEQDNGIYNAMNKGIKHCTGDIVGFINADDWFTSKDVVEKFVSEFTDKIDAVYGDIHSVDEKDRDKQVYATNSQLFRPSLLRFGIAPPHPSFYVRKAILDKYGYFNDTFRLAADFDLIARLIYKYKIRTKYVHLDFVTMTRGGASTKDEAAYQEGLNEILCSCKNIGIKTNRKLLKAKRYYSILANRI